jgi:hypothetical protein
VIEIPLIRGKGMFVVRKSFLDVLESAYPKVDGLQTLREIRAWCVANPSECWTARGASRAVNRWFEREQNRPPRR